MNKTILHIVNQSPFEKPCLTQCLTNLSDNDGIIFLENGVYSLLSKHPHAAELSTKTCYVIKADLDARGLDTPKNIPVELVDFNQFVQLCTEYDLVQSWY